MKSELKNQTTYSIQRQFQYVFIFGLFAFYLSYLRIPVLLQKYVQLKTMELMTQLPQQYKFDFFQHTKEKTNQGSFNAETFIKNYQCNQQHAFVTRIQTQDPVLMILDDFLAEGEADYLIHTGKDRLDRSSVTNYGEDYELSDYRTSYSAFYDRSENPVLKCIEQRVSHFVGLPLVNIEPLQLLRYNEGQQYKVHHDSFGDDEEFFKTDGYEMHGDRFATIFVYLNTLAEGNGGETEFPELNIKVSPVKNRAVFWKNLFLNQTVDERLNHAGLPVKNHDTKYGLNIWIREKCYEGCWPEMEDLPVDEHYEQEQMAE